ncbi:restriction endonuclease subunit S [Enterococcus faecium]|uniref:restriction endonuclease subunit S n=1 Tax=Enterococcus faecium TaxID=1352 RepID=UPI00295E8C7B|nr:restriction endonuclease subunit S [Enterococcus faecium]MDW3607664.1 restriction endonuclease subunit S [Enterococcus faecium]MDW3629611.1 restriction endonuclease subunit S [Enterococcus faecium]WOV56298.1 restriction endonuclease subunit S [Enterococcus faecium]
MSNDTQPEIRFPGFTEAWEQRKVFELGEIITGNTPSTGNKDYYKGQYLFVSPADIQDNRYVSKTNTTLTELGFKTGRFIRKGSTLFVSIGSTIGKVGQADRDLITNQQINSIIPSNDYDDNFVYSILLGKSAKIKQLAATQAVPIINKTEFGKTIINVPSFEEQIKIGTFFKQLDDTIALHQRKLDLLKETKKGFLQKMFPKNGAKVPEVRFPGFTEDWEQRKLGDIFKKDIQKNKDLEFNSDSVISVAKMKLSTPSAKSLDEYMKTYNKIWKGNIAFEGHTNDEFPNGRFVLNDCQDGIVSHIYDVYSAVDEYDNEFMKRYINNPYVMRKILINATSSARMMKSLNSVEFLKQSILLPILSEQQKIGGFFYQLDNIIAFHQRKLDLLKETKKGFLQKMFV